MASTFTSWTELYDHADVNGLSIIIKYKNLKGRITNYVRVNGETFNDMSESNTTIIDLDDTSESFVHVWSKRTISTNEGSEQQQSPLYTAISKNDVWSTFKRHRYTTIDSDDLA